MNYLDRANELRRLRSQRDKQLDDNRLGTPTRQLDGISWRERAHMVIKDVKLE